MNSVSPKVTYFGDNLPSNAKLEQQYQITKQIQQLMQRSIDYYQKTNFSNTILQQNQLIVQFKDQSGIIIDLGQIYPVQAVTQDTFRLVPYYELPIKYELFDHSDGSCDFKLVGQQNRLQFAHKLQSNPNSIYASDNTQIFILSINKDNDHYAKVLIVQNQAICNELLIKLDCQLQCSNTDGATVLLIDANQKMYTQKIEKLILLNKKLIDESDLIVRTVFPHNKVFKNIQIQACCVKHSLAVVATSFPSIHLFDSICLQDIYFQDKFAYDVKDQCSIENVIINDIQIHSINGQTHIIAQIKRTGILVLNILKQQVTYRSFFIKIFNSPYVDKCIHYSGIVGLRTIDQMINSIDLTRNEVIKSQINVNQFTFHKAIQNIISQIYGGYKLGELFQLFPSVQLKQIAVSVIIVGRKYLGASDDYTKQFSAQILFKLFNLCLTAQKHDLCYIIAYLLQDNDLYQLLLKQCKNYQIRKFVASEMVKQNIVPLAVINNFDSAQLYSTLKEEYDPQCSELYLLAKAQTEVEAEEIFWLSG